MFLTIIAESTHNVASIVPVSMGKFQTKGLRQAGLIIPKCNFKTGVCLWIPDLKFHLGVSLLGNVYR